MTPDGTGPRPNDTFYRTLLLMERSLGRIETKLDDCRQELTTVSESQKGLADRVDSLEDTRTYLKGIYAAIAGTWGLIAYYLLKP